MPTTQEGFFFSSNKAKVYELRFSELRGHYNTDKARTDSYNTNQGRRHYYITEDQLREHCVVAVSMAQHVPIQTVEQKSEDCIKNVLIFRFS